MLEVSTNPGPYLVPAARDKLNLRVARQNVNLCRVHNNRHGHCLPQPGVNACRPARRWRYTPIAYSTSTNVPAGSQAAPGCIPRRPACVERSIPSDPDRRRVVPQTGDDSRNGSARCQRQSSRDTCGPRRSPSFSMCHPRRSAVGPRRAGCPTSAPWVATDATPTPRSGPCWKPCPSPPRSTSRSPHGRHHCCPWLGGRSDRPPLEWGRAKPGHGATFSVREGAGVVGGPVVLADKGS
jgi:hypothetical protein